VPAALREQGVRVEVHADHFHPGTADRDWLAEVGRRGWAILTKDRHVRTRQNEIAQIIEANAAAFVLASAGLSGEDMANAYVKALRRMLNMLRDTRRPFVARVSITGEVELLAVPKK
jgi:PIN domain-containing protein